jgi:hypothetical protein
MAGAEDGKPWPEMVTRDAANRVVVDKTKTAG